MNIMNIIPKPPYRRFFWWFTLLPSVLIVALAIVLLFLAFLYGDNAVFVAILLGMLAAYALPICAIIAWTMAHLQWHKSLKHIVFSAILGFGLTLIYEFIVMMLHDVFTHQVGSYFHKEVLWLALLGMCITGVGAALFLPKKSF